MKFTKFAGVFSLIAGIVMIVVGATAWGVTSFQLSSENITVPPDAPYLAEWKVTGPFTAFAQAETVKMHAQRSSEGLTYAELGAKVREAEDAGDEETAKQLQEVRNTVSTSNFIRASLFASVLSFALSALVMGAGLVIGIIGWALVQISKLQPAQVKQVEEPTAA